MNFFLERTKKKKEKRESNRGMERVKKIPCAKVDVMELDLSFMESVTISIYNFSPSVEH